MVPKYESPRLSILYELLLAARQGEPYYRSMKQRPDIVRFGVKPNGSGICKHSSTEHLGFNDGVAFLRCCDCAHVLVLQGRRGWAIPPPQSE